MGGKTGNTAEVLKPRCEKSADLCQVGEAVMGHLVKWSAESKPIRLLEMRLIRVHGAG